MSNRYWVAPPSRSQHREFRWPRRARGPPLFRPHSLQYFHTCCVRTLELPGTGPSPTDRGSGLCLYGLEKREALRGLQKRECEVEQGRPRRGGEPRWRPFWQVCESPSQALGTSSPASARCSGSGEGFSGTLPAQILLLAAFLIPLSLPLTLGQLWHRKTAMLRKAAVEAWGGHAPTGELTAWITGQLWVRAAFSMAGGGYNCYDRHIMIN